MRTWLDDCYVGKGKQALILLARVVGDGLKYAVRYTYFTNCLHGCVETYVQAVANTAGLTAVQVYPISRVK